ncbi:nuclear transport factor 2 family protein [Halostreptopolyspora alba]|uniref:Nuclear transport factor 2 family protein n=1 Tax=Halostreptopolyspora alba TaxID=2487137 RepID=A0A3N0E700_9ACTN|nr:nuclear transport factor 2 family protein [Nocardiopsaceae bacterium YIM 96095]
MDSDSDIDTVIANELRLLDPEVRREDDAVRALLHDDFREIGASGTQWDRDSVTRATRADTGERTTAEDLSPVRLGSDAILLTYTARRGRSGSLRTSVWLRSDGEWRMLHHQGTPVPESP